MKAYDKSEVDIVFSGWEADLKQLSEIEVVSVDVLDKIRDAIDKQEKWLLQAGYSAYNTDIAFDAIKRVMAESEE